MNVESSCGPGPSDSGNEFDRFLFPFLEVESWITELSCNYPTRNENLCPHHWLGITFGDYIGPKKITKTHRYRSNNRLRPNRFWDRKGTKTINNCKIIGLNRMGPLKHRIEIFFVRSTKKSIKKNL